MSTRASRAGVVHVVVGERDHVEVAVGRRFLPSRATGGRAADRHLGSGFAPRNEYWRSQFRSAGRRCQRRLTSSE